MSWTESHLVMFTSMDAPALVIDPKGDCYDLGAFKLRRRRGNLMITVCVIVVVVMLISSLLALLVGQKASARAKAAEAGDLNSYIAITNLCADAFMDDLEGQTFSKVIASVDNPDGEFGLEVFDEAAIKLQEGLTLVSRADGSWQHPLVVPMHAVEYAGVSDTKVLKLLSKLLDDASVEITVIGPLGVAGGLADVDGEVENRDTMEMEDIFLRVTLKKGTTKVVQDYRLTGERLNARYEDTLIWFSVDDSGAECLLESQTVTRTNVSG